MIRRFRLRQRSRLRFCVLGVRHGSYAAAEFLEILGDSIRILSTLCGDGGEGFGREGRDMIGKREAVGVLGIRKGLHTA